MAFRVPCFFEEDCHANAQLLDDLIAMDSSQPVSLLAKWLPSVNASSQATVRCAKRLAKELHFTEAEYRKTLVKLRKYIAIIENNLRTRDYTFNYAKQPSKAMLKYHKAFLRNDSERYADFLAKVKRGEAKLHTGTLLPYEIVAPIVAWNIRSSISEEERQSIDVTWRALEDFTNGENALVVVDGSGSMYGAAEPLPAAVALSLAIYFAERNTGAFQNHFITFSHNPQLVEIKGEDIYDKVVYCSSFNEVANTNIQRVFELILSSAVKNNMAQSDLPAAVYIISDMEFDSCTKDAELTNFAYAKNLFEAHGYTFPLLIFWNVASRSRQQPVSLNAEGVVLVSGASARVFSMISCGNLSPYSFMLDTLSSQRYAAISA